MTPHAPSAVTGEACGVCGGPCREPFRLDPVHDNYPFMSPEAIAMTQQQPAEPEQEEPVVKPTRGRRRGQDRAHVLEEDRAHHPDEDR